MSADRELSRRIHEEPRFAESSYPKFAFSYHTYMARGLSKREAKRCVANLKLERVFVSEHHQVAVNDFMHSHEVHGKWLSFKRKDKGLIRDRETYLAVLQGILGEGWVGIELYPVERRLVDVANQYHLWCFQEKDLPLIEEGSDGWRLGEGEASLPLIRIALPDEETSSHDWLRVQALKNQQAGTQCEGFMLFCNASSTFSRHQDALWVMPEGKVMPFGFR